MAIESRPTRLLQLFLGIIVFATIVVLGAKLYRLHDQAHIRYKPGQEILWLAPTASNTEPTNTVISNTRWQLDYSDIERVLWEVPDLGNNPSTSLKLLERVNRLLPENLASDELVRLRALVEKSVLSDNVHTIADWIIGYYHYKKTDLQLKSAMNQAPDIQRMTLIRNYLANLEARQQKHFGSFAPALFEQQNSQTRYFYQRLLVRLDKSLNEVQKKAALATIKLDYQAKLEILRSD